MKISKGGSESWRCDRQRGIFALNKSGGKHLLGRPKRHIFGTAKVGEKGQIVIPKDARTLFGIQPGDTLLILGDEQTGIIVTKPDVIETAAAQIFEQMERQK